MDGNINVISTGDGGICSYPYKSLPNGKKYSIKKGDFLIVLIKSDGEDEVIFTTKEYGEVFDYLIKEYYERET